MQSEVNLQMMNQFSKKERKKKKVKNCFSAGYLY